MSDIDATRTSIQFIIAGREAVEDEKLWEHLKTLRNLSARGKHIQELLATDNELHECLKPLMFGTSDTRIKTMAWQLVANTTVNNTAAQADVWQRYGEMILENFSKPLLGSHTNIQLMILYNVLKSETTMLNEVSALKAITQLWRTIIAEKYEPNLEFLHFLYEHFIVTGGRTTVRGLMQITSTDRIAFLDYLASYVRHDSPNGLMHTFLLQHISKEFKMKSDCILRQLTQPIDEAHPREVHALLRVIASATGSEKYEQLYTQDHALFLNVSSLLRCLVAAGKENTKNMFTPMDKLHEVAPSSMEVNSDFESDISFELKTLLVRCIANLLYKNPINQGYCLDTQVMPTLFECTNMDARNPLMKEWSILAIRNACIGCPEIQKIVANLTQQNVVKNDIVEELNLEMGSLRIQPGKE